MSVPSLSPRAFELLTWLSDEQWVKPMDLGGRDGSHHSGTLALLVRHGLAERRRRTKPWGAVRAWMYRRTSAGRTRAVGARPADTLKADRWPGG